MKKREAKILKEKLLDLKRLVIYMRAANNDIHPVVAKIDIISHLIDRWVEQKWVAAVDEVMETRIDCELGRLTAA